MKLTKYPASKKILEEYKSSPRLQDEVATVMNTDEYKAQKKMYRKQRILHLLLCVPRFVKSHALLILALATLLVGILAIPDDRLNSIKDFLSNIFSFL